MNRNFFIRSLTGVAVTRATLDSLQTPSLHIAVFIWNVRQNKHHISSAARICGAGYDDKRTDSMVWGALQVGFQLIDTIARAEGIAVNKLQEGAAVGRGRLAGQRILLAKPMTFMNVSGESVRKLVNFYKVRHTDPLP